ncbi:Transcriptional adapter 1 [Orchesella cincta]|uniref:Transcriptional adapter 1 n=1 Tax=Orchesella cincta TaxID=48709 RepID=A0A1D2MA39_ORCCI|nr:Transcriptional adapter 1 [Orchesella cincta]
MGDLPIALIKQQLQQELGPENYASYLRLFREWFGQRLTKHMFDYEVSSFLQERCLELHNLLLQSILLHCIAGIRGKGEGSVSSSQQPQFASQPYSTTTNSVTGTSSSVVDAQYQGHDEKDDENMYIIPTIPGEEPFLYPPNAQEYPVESIETRGAVDMMEQETPTDIDWLHPVHITYPAAENIEKAPNTKNRFPPWFAHDYQRVNMKNYTHEVNVVPNVTHLLNMKDIVERKPQLKQHFVIPGDNKAPYLTCGSSLYGRILTKAWAAYNIQVVNPRVTEHTVNAVRDHIKNVIIAIIQQRRPFRMRDKRLMHSMGVPYPNPYLRQGYHMYDEAYGSDTTKMADVVMQVPAPFPTFDEKERLAALQVAATYPEKDSRFTSAKGTMMDFLLAIQHNPSLIPHQTSRFKLVDSLLRMSKGFAGSHNVQFGDCDDEEDMQTSTLLPVASY